MGDHAAAVPPALWRFTGRRAGQGVVSSARGALHLRNDRGGPCLPRRCCRQAPLDPFAPFDSARAPEAGSSTWSGRPPRNRLSHTPSAVLLAKPLGRLPTTMPAASRAPVSPCPRRRPPPPARCERPSRQAVPRRARDGGSEAGSRCSEARGLGQLRQCPAHPAVRSEARPLGEQGWFTLTDPLEAEILVAADGTASVAGRETPPAQRRDHAVCCAQAHRNSHTCAGPIFGRRPS